LVKENATGQKEEEWCILRKVGKRDPKRQLGHRNRLQSTNSKDEREKERIDSKRKLVGPGPGKKPGKEEELG